MLCGDARADFVHLLQLLFAGIHQRIHRTEMLSQKLRRAFAHEANAEAVDHALQRQFLWSYSISSSTFCADLSPMRSSESKFSLVSL